MTDEALETKKALFAKLTVEEAALWNAKNRATDAWHIVRRMQMELQEEIEKEEQHRKWLAEWRATNAVACNAAGIPPAPGNEP